MDNEIETGIRLGFELWKFVDHIYKEYDMSYAEIAILFESTSNALKQRDDESH